LDTWAQLAEVFSKIPFKTINWWRDKSSVSGVLSEITQCTQ